MTNKVKTIVFFLIIGLMIGIIVKRMFFSSIHSVTYKIFSATTDGYYFHKLLGIVPESYQEGYEQTILESFDGKELVNLVDKKSSGHPNFVLLKNGTKSVRFLKAYPFDLVGFSDDSIENTTWRKHVTFLIDLTVFNEYVQYKHLSSIEEVTQKYCYMLSNLGDKTSYKILNDSANLLSLIDEKPLINKDFLRDTGYHLITPQEINFSKVSNTLVYCWFHDKGVVEFVFTFNTDNTVRSVRSDIIGLIGNEFPSI